MELLDHLKRLTAALIAERIPFALCGGLALAVHEVPRATLDIDLLIEAELLERVKAVARELGFTIDSGRLQFRDGRIQIYRLGYPDKVLGDVVPLDLLLVTPEIAEVWRSRETVVWEGGELPVVSREGLIKLKAIRASRQDLEDIERLRGEAT
ncbi:MAG: nucleotidyl transferase AbiEii/AbiGii toxin family protein [Planctomycetota bacterium]